MPIEPPKVTGLSPKEGPPGTKITIRGENLGISQQDLIGLTICGADCLMYAEWKSPSKIIARCGAASAGIRGEVTVITRSSGKGTCTVQFRCFLEPIDLTKESAIWVDESHMITVSYGRNRPTSPSQIHPDDPLRLSDEGNIGRFPEEELHDMFPEGSGNLLSENFVPAWYLLENHHGASFDALQAGLSCLRWKVGQRKEGPIAFLKSNVLSIVDCLDVLVSLQSLLIKDKQEAGVDLTKKLEDAITKSKQNADLLFQEVLARKDKADSTRNALGVLQRFRFLFNLPASIERNIQKGDYDVVINDYARAKQLFHNTEVAVFKKVYQEVEQRIEQFRNMLTRNLKKLPCSMDEQKKLIRYLVNLEAPGDPAWGSIQNFTTWIISSMNTSRDSYLDSIKESGNENEDQSVANENNWENDTPQVVLFVEEITKFYSENFPELWKLGQAYLNGQLNIREIQAQNNNQADKQLAFKTMVLDVTNRMCNLLRAALLSHTLNTLHLQQLANLGCWPKSQTGEVLRGWLPSCIRSIRQCYSSILKLDLHEDILNVIQQLLFDLRVFTMTTLFTQAADDIRNLHLRETWDIEIDDQNGATTQLPLLFENIVVETLQRIRDTVLHCGPTETEIFSQITVQANIKHLSQSLLQSFVVALEKMAFPPEQNKSTPVKLLPVSSDSSNIDNYQDITSGDKRLLIILSNSSYTTQIIIPRLQETYQKYNYPDMSLVIKCSQAKYRELETKLFHAYLEHKCDPIVGAIEPKMYANQFDWKKCPKPIGVSAYVKDIVMNMIAVHAEVFSVSPPFVEKVMTRIVEAVIEELSRLFQCVGIFLQDGNIQATLDNKALEITLQDYQTYSSGKSFKTCRNHLTGIGDIKDKELIQELLKKFENQMQMQLLCFAKEKIVSV